MAVSGMLFGVVVVLTLVPVLLGETSLGYLIPITGMDVIILVFTMRMLKSQSPEEGRRAMRVMYISATLGLAAFILSRF